MCGYDKDTKQHLLVCDQLCESDAVVSTLPDNDDSFRSNLDDKVAVSRILMSNFEKRKILMKAD